MKNIIPFIILPFVAILGSFISKKVKEGHNILYIFISSFLVTAIWVWILRTTKYSLAVNSLIFDSLMTIGYFVGFLLLGDHVTLLQWIGATLAIIGMILMGV